MQKIGFYTETYKRMHYLKLFDKNFSYLLLRLIIDTIYLLLGINKVNKNIDSFFNYRVRQSLV